MKPDPLIVHLGAATLLSLSLALHHLSRRIGNGDSTSTVGAGGHLSLATGDGHLEGQPRRCLIVDDDPLVRSVVCDMLKSQGYETVMAGDGLEGLEKFKEERFDLVLTDLRMPRLDGLQFTRAGKGLRRFVPFLLLTGFSGSVTEKELSEAAVDRVLSKPIRLSDLETAISELA